MEEDTENCASEPTIFSFGNLHRQPDVYVVNNDTDDYETRPVFWSDGIKNPIFLQNGKHIRAVERAYQTRVIRRKKSNQKNKDDISQTCEADVIPGKSEAVTIISQEENIATNNSASQRKSKSNDGDTSSENLEVTRTDHNSDNPKYYRQTYLGIYKSRKRLMNRTSSASQKLPSDKSAGHNLSITSKDSTLSASQQKEGRGAEIEEKGKVEKDVNEACDTSASRGYMEIYLQEKRNRDLILPKVDKELPQYHCSKWIAENTQKDNSFNTPGSYNESYSEQTTAIHEKQVSKTGQSFPNDNYISGQTTTLRRCSPNGGKSELPEIDPYHKYDLKVPQCSAGSRKINLPPEHKRDGKKNQVRRNTDPSGKLKLPSIKPDPGSANTYGGTDKQVQSKHIYPNQKNKLPPIDLVSKTQFKGSQAENSETMASKKSQKRVVDDKNYNESIPITSNIDFNFSTGYIDDKERHIQVSELSEPQNRRKRTTNMHVPYEQMSPERQLVLPPIHSKFPQDSKNTSRKGTSKGKSKIVKGILKNSKTKNKAADPHEKFSERKENDSPRKVRFSYPDGDPVTDVHDWPDVQLPVGYNDPESLGTGSLFDGPAMWYYRNPPQHDNSKETNRLQSHFVSDQRHYKEEGRYHASLYSSEGTYPGERNMSVDTTGGFRSTKSNAYTVAGNAFIDNNSRQGDPFIYGTYTETRSRVDSRRMAGENKKALPKVSHRNYDGYNTSDDLGSFEDVTYNEQFHFGIEGNGPNRKMEDNRGIAIEGAQTGRLLDVRHENGYGYFPSENPNHVDMRAGQEVIAGKQSSYKRTAEVDALRQQAAVANMENALRQGLGYKGTRGGIQRELRALETKNISKRNQKELLDSRALEERAHTPRRMAPLPPSIMYRNRHDHSAITKTNIGSMEQG